MDKLMKIKQKTCKSQKVVNGLYCVLLYCVCLLFNKPLYMTHMFYYVQNYDLKSFLSQAVGRRSPQIH